jgi:L-2-hydroxyglutarate oxidase LhgO
MMHQSTDVLIVGAGVIGLAIGIALLDGKSDTRVTVLEKEAQLGKHASGRNSGVLHAGFYYSPDSLKAKFCRDGNAELKVLCNRHGIPVKEVGKVVVAKNLSENLRLDDLYQKGQMNGVELELLPASRLSDFEQFAVTHERFLWSPRTAISDSIAVLAAMRQEFQQRGGLIRTGVSAELIEESGEITVPGYSAKLIVNASGAQSDRIARSLGLAKQYAMLPFMGIYRSTTENQLPISRLVYPVPHPINPFLGVHLTLTLDGKVKIGPTAIPILGREQYSLISGWSMSDIGQSVLAANALIRGEAHSVWEILKSELPKLSQRSLVKAAVNLVPSAASVKSWEKRPPGIRAQLVDKRTGRLEQDFVVEQLANSVHVLNAVSPGWTSALPFGRWIAEQKLLPLL